MGSGKGKVSFINGVEDDEHNVFMEYLTSQFGEPEITAPLPPLPPAAQAPPLPPLSPSSSLPPKSTFCLGRTRKVLSSQKIGELSKKDPEKAKKIIASRLSNGKVRETKRLHELNLEEKLNTLNSEVASLRASLLSFQINKNTSEIENLQLKQRMDMVSNQLEARKLLTELMQNEIMRLGILARIVQRNGMDHSGNYK